MKRTIFRPALTMPALALAMTLGSGLPASGARATAEGEERFRAQCADCHGPRDVAHWGKQRPDTEARRAWLDEFLQRHYPPSDEDRALIVDYIQREIAGE